MVFCFFLAFITCYCSIASAEWNNRLFDQGACLGTTCVTLLTGSSCKTSVCMSDIIMFACFLACHVSPLVEHQDSAPAVQGQCMQALWFCNVEGYSCLHLYVCCYTCEAYPSSMPQIMESAIVRAHPPQDHLACGFKRLPYKQLVVGSISGFSNLVYELKMGQVGKGGAP